MRCSHSVAGLALELKMDKPDQLGRRWTAAPRHTQWGADMMEALVPLGNDHTLRLYVEAGALHLVGPALRSLTTAREQRRTMFARRPGLWALQAREVLELIAAPRRPDGTWNRDREACRQMAAEALGRYED